MSIAMNPPPKTYMVNKVGTSVQEHVPEYVINTSFQDAGATQ